MYQSYHRFPAPPAQTFRKVGSAKGLLRPESTLVQVHRKKIGNFQLQRGRSTFLYFFSLFLRLQSNEVMQAGIFKSKKF